MKRIGSRVASWVVVATVVAMMSPVSMSFAAVANNEVTSVKLKEADGTSGQDTNSGSGVKTGHIQDGAISTSKIVDGAVTDAKITGPISAAKITDGVFQKRYANVVVVAKNGGDFNTINAALASITNASADNQYLVNIMPGTYYEQISTKDYVMLKGAGREVTKISYNSDNNGNATVNVTSNNSPIEGLTIEGSNLYLALAVSATFGRGLFTDCNIVAKNGSSNVALLVGPGGFSIKNSNVVATGWGDAYGIRSDSYGVSQEESSFDGSSVNVISENSAFGFYIISDGQTINVTNSKITQTSPGIYDFAFVSQRNATIYLNNTIVTGKHRSIISQGAAFKAYNTQISGVASGSLKLTNCVDGNYDTIPNQ